MASKEETDKKSLIIMEMANRELRQDLMMALILISNKKETWTNMTQRKDFSLNYLNMIKLKMTRKLWQVFFKINFKN